MTAEQLLDNTSHMDWLTTSEKMLVEVMMETYKELALEEVKNNVALHNVSKTLLAEEFNNGYIRGCEDTEANYKANT